MIKCENKQEVNNQCGTNRFRIVQIHPTLRCNLNCLHCYSSSGPGIQKELDLEKLKLALEILRAQGFNVISISGGEPFMFKQLESLLQYSKELGYYNMVTTNAMLLKSSRSKKTLKQIDLIAISIDGKPKKHNYLRNCPAAFDKTLEGIKIARDHIPNLGFIHTVTPKSIEDLFWLSEFTISQGAKLLQLHPLEMSGRGLFLKDLKLNQENLKKIYILSFILQQKYARDFSLQLDLLHKEIVQEQPQLIYGDPLNFSGNKLGGLLRNIIIDENGNLLPFAHGIGDFYKIGNIYTNDLGAQIKKFKEIKIPFLKELCQHIFQYIQNLNNISLFNWHEMVVNFSKK